MFILWKNVLPLNKHDNLQAESHRYRISRQNALLVKKEIAGNEKTIRKIHENHLRKFEDLDPKYYNCCAVQSLSDILLRTAPTTTAISKRGGPILDNILKIKMEVVSR